jgi:large subunit ribosomal protein L9
MKVVLLEKVQNLGIIGAVVAVKNGFARNFLIPKKKALRATPETLAIFEKRRSIIEADNLKKKDEAEAVSAKIAGLRVRVIRQAGESGRLFGSVRNSDVASAIAAAGFVINKSQVIISTPIKMLGVYQVKLALHPDVFAEIKLNVAQSEEEADAQVEEEARSEGKQPAEQLDAESSGTRETSKGSHRNSSGSRRGARDGAALRDAGGSGKEAKNEGEPSGEQ